MKLKEWRKSFAEGGRAKSTTNDDERRHKRRMFEFVIDFGAPVTIYERNDNLEILQTDTLCVQQLINDINYVDFKKRPLNLKGCTFCQVEVGEKQIIKTCILIVPNDL